MIYAAASVWVTVVMLLAWGVHHLWSTIVKPKVVNGVLLPGTLIAQLGHIVGLLITGGTVNNTALMRGDEKGSPGTDPSPQPKIPVIGPVIVALLPMLALGRDALSDDWQAGRAGVGEDAEGPDLRAVAGFAGGVLGPTEGPDHAGRGDAERGSQC